ncbi:MAG: MFS transporter [Chloroflexi bacterium]|nr:MFS transporter [Chloroflexota bacterium]
MTLVWLLYVAFGLVNRSISPLVTPILDDLNMSYSQMGIILGSWQLTYIVVAIIAGTIIDKWGMRKSLFIGTVIIGLSAALRYFPNGFGSFLPVVAIFGIGGPLISIGAPKTIASWFRGKGRGTAVGIYTTGPWIGGLFALAATNSFVMPITGYSWRLTFVYYGFLALIIALLWWFLARDIKPTEATESESIGKVFSRLIKIRNVRLILIMGLLSFAIMHGFTNWLPKIMESGGMSPTTAGFMASIPVIAGIPAVLIIPRLVPPHLRGRLLALLSLVVAVTLLVSVNTLDFPLFVGLALFGIAGTSLFPIVILILMETPEVGERHMGLAGGIFFCVAEVGGFTGPLLMGTLADLTGTFLAGAVFLAGLSLIIFMMTLLLKAPSESN